MKKIFYSDIESSMGTIWAAKSQEGLIRFSLLCCEQTFLEELGSQITEEPEYRQSKLDGISEW